MADPIIEALRKRTGKPKRGALRLWMRKNYAEMERLLADGLTWEGVEQTLAELGVKNDRGDRVSWRRAQQTWYAVRKDMRGVAPVPVADTTPAVPTSPGPNREVPESPGNPDFWDDAGDGFGFSDGPLPPRTKEDE